MGSADVGQIDKGKLYSYARSATQIAQVYAADANVTVCGDPPTLDIATIGAMDCVNDILDFAEFAVQWLDKKTRRKLGTVGVLKKAPIPIFP